VQTRDEYAPDHPLPVFLSREAQFYEEPRRSSWLIRVGLAVVAALVIGAAMTLSLGHPMSIFADASPSDSPAAQPATDQSTPPAPQVQTATTATDAGQTAAIPQGNTPGNTQGNTQGSTASRDDVAATSNPGSDGQAATADPPPGALLKQFQSWAAAQDAEKQGGSAPPAQDAPTQVEPVRPMIQNTQAPVEPIRPIQDVTTRADPAPPVQDVATQDQATPAPVRAVRKHRKSTPLQNARAEIRPAKPTRAGDRHFWKPPAEARTAQDARPPQGAPDPQPAQNAGPPSLLQSIGISR
jgi:hypothetical protein